jgi:hypothetical protein
LITFSSFKRFSSLKTFDKFSQTCLVCSFAHHSTSSIVLGFSAICHEQNTKFQDFTVFEYGQIAFGAFDVVNNKVIILLLIKVNLY